MKICFPIVRPGQNKGLFSMVVKCISCHCEDQVVKNVAPCDGCGSPMRSIGSDYMSDCDDSITPHDTTLFMPNEDEELPLDFMIPDHGLRLR